MPVQKKCSKKNVFFKNKLYSTDFQNNFLDKEWVYIYNSINK